MWQLDAYRMIQRRTADAGIEIHIGNHTFRATGIAAYLKNSGKLEVARHIANHESPRTTKLYDRKQDEISLDEVERLRFRGKAGHLVRRISSRSVAQHDRRPSPQQGLGRIQV
jgi:hypothetical protein